MAENTFQINADHSAFVTDFFDFARKKIMNLDAEGNQLLETVAEFKYDNLVVPPNPQFLSVATTKYFEMFPPDPSLEASLKEFDFYYLRFPVDMKPRIGYQEVQVDLVGMADEVKLLPIFYSAFPVKKHIDYVTGHASGSVEVNAGFNFSIPKLETPVGATAEAQAGGKIGASLGFNFDFSLGQNLITPSGLGANSMHWLFEGGDIQSSLNQIAVVLQCPRNTDFKIKAITAGRRKMAFFSKLSSLLGSVRQMFSAEQKDYLDSGFEFKPQPVIWARPQ